ncbi:uncharacterized protein DS421_3g73680 [Arachis hypogaea]|nr:uncharacterized protein DS421_3g73680 [Arachis hypogaea]
MTRQKEGEGIEGIGGLNFIDTARRSDDGRKENVWKNRNTADQSVNKNLLQIHNSFSAGTHMGEAFIEINANKMPSSEYNGTRRNGAAEWTEEEGERGYRDGRNT